MKLFLPLPVVAIIGLTAPSYAQTSPGTDELPLITATLMNYIDGTANGDPDQVRRAFHPDFNLYTVNDADSLWIRSGAKYIDGIKVGEKNTRQGRIISIDVEGNAAMAKAEIAIPGWRIFTDYFLLLKYEGAWKIVQKSYTWREWPKGEEKKEQK
ncbi:MAG: nuclear transport factor 2 family protein [Flavobacteriales bacterium]|nr:nuclear transport factor 2 family protein [Flavobacteriales bacterium]